MGKDYKAKYYKECYKNSAKEVEYYKNEAKKFEDLYNKANKDLKNIKSEFAKFKMQVSLTDVTNKKDKK